MFVYISCVILIAYVCLYIGEMKDINDTRDGREELKLFC